MKTLLKLSLFSLLIFCACSGRKVRPDSFQGSGLSVGDITVRLDNSTLDADRVAVFKKLDGAGKLDSEITSTLQTQRMFDRMSLLSMRVAVTEFRLRNAGSAITGGLLAGEDAIGASVEIVDGSTVVHRFNVREGSYGKMFEMSREARGSSMIQTLAKKITDELRYVALNGVRPVYAQRGKSAVGSGPSAADTSKASITKTSACSAEQILDMKKQKLSDEQISFACSY